MHADTPNVCLVDQDRVVGRVEEEEIGDGTSAVDLTEGGCLSCTVRHCSKQVRVTIVQGAQNGASSDDLRQDNWCSGRSSGTLISRHLGSQHPRNTGKVGTLKGLNLLGSVHCSALVGNTIRVRREIGCSQCSSKGSHVRPNRKLLVRLNKRNPLGRRGVGNVVPPAANSSTSTLDHKRRRVKRSIVLLSINGEGRISSRLKKRQRLGLVIIRQVSHHLVCHIEICTQDNFGNIVDGRKAASDNPVGALDGRGVTRDRGDRSKSRGTSRCWRLRRRRPRSRR